GQEQRNYRLSGDLESLAAARRAQVTLAAPVMRLHGLVADDTSQLRQVEALAGLIGRDAQSLTADLAPIEVRFSDGRLPAALAATIAWTQAIETAVDQMVDYERKLLLDELAVNESRNATMLGTGTLARTIGVVAVVGVYIVARGRSQKAKVLAATQFAALQ